jgi:crotonobetainyl-CoA:carnitine CoA-transferase CaiB-like acyl-CoA transferase
MVDKATALTVAQAISAALFHRERTGEGNHIVVPMLDAGLYFYWPDGMMDFTLMGDDVMPGPRIADTYSLTQCADGQVIYYAPTNDMRLRLFSVLGHPEFCDDPRYNDVAGLMEGDNFVTVGAVLAAEFEKLEVAEVIRRFVEAEIPVAPILSPDEVLVDEQIVHNEAVVTWEHPVAGQLRQPRHPVRFSCGETPVPTFAPGLGEHTDEILTELGRTPEQIARLREHGVVA